MSGENRSRSRERAKGRKEKGSFVAVPHAVLEHPNYHKLTHRAVRLLWDLYGQYKGANNGDLCASYSVMRSLGWNSNDQIRKALKELLQTGWIVTTRQGYRPRVCSLYAVTFQPIDECGGKLSRVATRTALGYWKLGHNPELHSDHRPTVLVVPPHGAMRIESNVH